MEHTQQLTQLLSAIPGPAFAARDGIVVCCNEAAKPLVTPGTPTCQLAETGKDYPLEPDDILYMALRTGSERWGATVTRFEDHYVFRLEQIGMTPELKAMSLLCSQLRVPIAGLSMATRKTGSPDVNREFSRILRILNNVSNAERFALADDSHRNLTNICDAVKRTLEECAELLKESDMILRYSVPETSTHTVLDWEMVRHAVYAMVDNAAKQTAPGAMIEAELTVGQTHAQLCITDHGSGIPDTVRSSLFSRYTRDPNCDFTAHNLGLGMTLIHTTALAHNGTVLVEKLGTKGTRVTMTLALDDRPPLKLHTFRTTLVPSRDDALVMLSNVLPSSLYEN